MLVRARIPAGDLVSDCIGCVRERKAMELREGRCLKIAPGRVRRPASDLDFSCGAFHSDWLQSPGGSPPPSSLPRSPGGASQRSSALPDPPTPFVPRSGAVLGVPGAERYLNQPLR